ncbi:MAG: hypothetical protein F4151_05215 [Gammaproteobacteria bacterium]|nr:hypothetical protein [Gammaproteobacteria bacterium]
MIDPDGWPEKISDEAAAHMAECLHRIAHDFEGRHYGQIRRHMEPLRPPPRPAEACHQRQLHLFGESCPPF